MVQRDVVIAVQPEPAPPENTAPWEDLDITGETSELPDQEDRPTPRPKEQYPANKIVGNQPKEGVRLTVSRSVFKNKNQI